MARACTGNDGSSRSLLVERIFIIIIIMQKCYEFDCGSNETRKSVVVNEIIE